MTALPVVETKQGEIFKQERLAPLPIEFQLAWMLAFNDGLLRDHYLFTTLHKILYVSLVSENQQCM